MGEVKRGWMYTVTFKFDKGQRDKIMAFMGRPGGQMVSSSEVEEWIRFIVRENLKEEAPKSTLRIKRRRKS